MEIYHNLICGFKILTFLHKVLQRFDYIAQDQWH
jgi:hypothetical protein